MKFITEINEHVEVLTEAAENGDKKFFIEGVFLQGNLRNKNGRIYPMSVLDPEVERYTKENIEKGCAYGELDHPDKPTINLNQVSHYIKSLIKEGDNYVGRAQIASTPRGQVAQCLIRDGANLGVSSRALGELKENNGAHEVVRLRINTPADIVADPSAPDAFVRGIMEGVEYWYDIGKNTWIEEKVDKTRKKINTLTLEQINEHKLKMFQNFLSDITKL